jgi:hypothetical protein
MYPGQAVLNTDQVAQVLGKTGSGGPQTIRNQIAAGKFPLQKKLRRIGGRIVLPVAALADWLDGAEAGDPAPAPGAQNKRKPSPVLPANPPARPRRGGRPPMILKEFLAQFEASWANMLRRPFDDEDYRPKAPDRAPLIA